MEKIAPGSGGEQARNEVSRCLKRSAETACGCGVQRVRNRKYGKEVNQVSEKDSMQGAQNRPKVEKEVRGKGVRPLTTRTAKSDDLGASYDRSDSVPSHARD